MIGPDEDVPRIPPHEDEGPSAQPAGEDGGRDTTLPLGMSAEDSRPGELAGNDVPAPDPEGITTEDRSGWVRAAATREAPGPAFTPGAGASPLPDYTLGRFLGRGGFGEVWQATGPGGFPLALKLIPLGGNEARVELRSLELMKTIRHAHLLSLFGTWLRHGYLIIAMELAEATLLDRLQEARAAGLPGIPAAELHEYMIETAKGLDYLNEPRHPTPDGGRAGIQHKDIKPQNLLLVGGTVKVGDFGLARLLEHTAAASSGSLTPIYAAPEQFRGQAAFWTDQYSLAVSYCQLRGGRLPFEGSLAEVTAGHLFQPPDLGMIPDAERPVVARALAKEPEKRWPCCRAFVEALSLPVRGRTPLPAPVAASGAVLARFEQLGAKLGREGPGPDQVTAADCSYSDITDEDLALVAELAGLRELNLFSCRRITGDGLRHVARLLCLETLVLSCTSISGEGLGHLAPLASLRELRLYGCDRIHDSALAQLRPLTGLQRLDLGRTPITHQGLVHLQPLQDLRDLDLGGTRANGPGFATLGQLQRLERLCLNGAEIGRSELVPLEAIPHLKELDLTSTQIGDPELKLVQRLQALRVLRLTGTWVSDEGLGHLQMLDRLEELDLGSTAVGERFRLLLPRARLRVLALTHTRLTDAGMPLLGRLSYLEKLGLAHTAVSDAGLTHLSGLPALRELDLSRTEVGEKHLDPLRDLVSLRQLRLDACRKVEDAGLETLGQLRALQGLDLGRTRISDGGLAALAGLSHLRDLCLRFTGVTDEGLAHLGRLHHLEELNLSYTKVTAGGLQALLPLERLACLHLSGTGITDEAVAALAGLGSLKRLLLYDTRINLDSLDQLRRQLPGLQIEM